MPYIKQKDRNSVGDGPDPISPGKLNYIITAACHEYIKRRELSYSAINEVIGVLECAKLEFYQQIARKYEDQKKLENGPVSELDKGKE